MNNDGVKKCLCWIIPVVVAWILMVIFTILIPSIGKYPVILVLPVGFFLLLFYGSYQYGRWYSSKSK